MGLRPLRALTAVTVMMVEQFGLAMMPWCSLASPGLISGTTRRDVRIHAEGRRIVDEHRAGLDDRRGEALGDVVLGRAEDDVHALKGGVAGLLHGDGAAVPPRAPFRRCARWPAGAAPDREPPLGQNLHHLSADGAGRAENGNVIFFHLDYLTLQKASYRMRMVWA